MKRLTAILTSIVLCMSIVMPAYATLGYVDSVTAKPAPGIVGEAGDEGTGTVAGADIGDILDENGNKVDDLLSSDIILTALADAEDLPEETKNELLEVFAAIEDGTMEYPAWLTELLGDNVVVKDLFDLTAISDKLIAYLEDGHSIQFTMDPNLAEDALVAVASYVDGEWINAIECVNNGDGTVTVTMSDLCPVAVFVEGEASSEPVGGDEPVGEGDCKICSNFFPFLGKAPIFDGACIICFVLIVLAVSAVCYVLYRTFKKKDEEK